jgi:hypothetical protein
MISNFRINIISCFIFLLIISGCGNHLLEKGLVMQKNYTDTIHFDRKFNWITFPIALNGTQTTVIFDTGAGISVFKNDETVKQKSNMSVEDAHGQRKMLGLETKSDIQIGSISYRNTTLAHTKFIPQLNCLCDGVLGNTVLRKSNWLVNIKAQTLIFTDKTIETAHTTEFPLHYLYGNRVFTNVMINDITVKNCMLDWGGSFEIELPNSYYDKLYTNQKPKNQYHKIQTSSGLYGKAQPDTSLRVMGKIRFNNYEIDSVVIAFSKKKECRIGTKFLERFKTMGIDNKNNKIYLSKTILPRQSSYRDLSFSVDIDSSKFIVENIVLEDTTQTSPRLGNELLFLNEKKVSDFLNYCEFFNWMMKMTTICSYSKK